MFLSFGLDEMSWYRYDGMGWNGMGLDVIS